MHEVEHFRVGITSNDRANWSLDAERPDLTLKRA